MHHSYEAEQHTVVVQLDGRVHFDALLVSGARVCLAIMLGQPNIAEHAQLLRRLDVLGLKPNVKHEIETMFADSPQAPRRSCTHP